MLDKKNTLSSVSVYGWILISSTHFFVTKKTTTHELSSFLNSRRQEVDVIGTSIILESFHKHLKVKWVKVLQHIKKYRKLF